MGSVGALEVIDPGLLSTVQDFGRPDAVGLGVPAGGACDHWSLGVANALAGNERDAATLEITISGPTLRVLDDCLIALAGADLAAQVSGPGTGGEQLLPGRSRQLTAGQTLSFEGAGERRGIRAYLALAGGMDVPPVLGSASTCLAGGFGGVDGRPLAAGDVLRSARLARTPAAQLNWPGRFRPELEATHRALRVLPGPHAERLPHTAFGRLLSTEFRISARGDRQGYVLDGPALPTPPSAEPMLSQGVPVGAIQLPPDGRPICLLADHQTVGGYPVLAVVISADLPLLGQLGPGDPVSFREVSLAEAEAALRRQEEEWQASLTRLSAA